MSHRLRLRGFTLVELLVVIAIIGILVALLLPAIQAARQAALKNSCRNNVKQLALSLQNHNDTYKSFPPLMFNNIPPAAGKTPTAGQKGFLDVKTGTGQYSWFVRVLPFIEEDTLFKAISTSSNKFAKASGAGAGTILQVPGTGTGLVNADTIKLNALICPSFSGDSDNGGGGIAASNYAALSATIISKLDGTGKNNTWKNTGGPDGMIVPDKLARGQSMARMADGTSKTAVLCESKEGAIIPTPSSGSAPTQTYTNSWWNPRHVYVVGFAPSATGAGAQPAKFSDVTATTVTAINVGPSTTSATQYDNTAPRRSYGPSSDHMGGIVIHGMGDGSVQEVTDTAVEATRYYAAITTRGGENVQGLGGD